MAVFAHPDDESCGPGGTLARHAAQRVEVTGVCATHGELGGDPQGTRKPDPELGRLRTAELEAACRALGVQRCIALDYPDGEVETRISELEAELVGLVRRLRPHVMLTFDPDSSLGGPDHQAVGIAAAGVFWKAGDSRYRPTSAESSPPYESLKLYWWLARPCCGAPSLPEGSVVATIDVSAYLEQRRAALLCQRTQVACCAGAIAHLSDPDEAFERFRLGAHRLGWVAQVEEDLFAGVESQ